MHIILRRGTGRDAIKGNGLERRQHAAVERGSEGGAPCVRDLGVADVERLELLQLSSHYPLLCKRQNAFASA